MIQDNCGSVAIRSGEWRLIPKESHPVSGNDELYNLKNDPSEKINLAERYPKIVKRLHDRITQIKESHGVR